MADIEEQQLDGALDLMRRLPPENTVENLVNLVAVAPDLSEELLSTIDQPPRIGRDAEGKEFLMCDYNRDGDSFRSPHTNEYNPPLADGAKPSAKLRELEVTANNAFATYIQLYYEGGLSSVYLWDLDDDVNGFAAAILIKKESDSTAKTGGAGCWDAMHIFQAEEDTSGNCTYQLTSTVMLWLENGGNTIGKMKLGGSLMRQKEQTFKLGPASTHIMNMGTMVEEMENTMRSKLDIIYFGRTKDIMNDVRLAKGKSENNSRGNMLNEMRKSLEKRST
eukprot:Clim_evm14s145 gene=Clim_evmTU14s145